MCHEEKSAIKANEINITSIAMQGDRNYWDVVVSWKTLVSNY